jgi:hypothetical protein
VALRRFFVLAVLVAGLAAGILAGVSSGAPRSHPSIPCLLAPGSQATTITIPCCGPPRAAPDMPCPCVTPCPVPTVPKPPPAGAPRLTIPKHGFRVRHGRFRVTCRLRGATGACAVTATNGGRIAATGRKTLKDGRARVTVKLVVAGRAMLNRARHRTMRVSLTATAAGRSSTQNATLHG